MRKIFVFLLSFFLATVTLAANTANNNSPLSLYDQPNNKAKVVATINPGQAIIPIFTQGDWVKIADPSNGNVGWVNNNTLTASGYPKMIVKIYGNQNNNSTVSGCQIVQYSGNQNANANSQQINVMFNNLQQQQKNLEDQMNTSFQQMSKTFNDIMQSMQANFQPVTTTPANQTSATVNTQHKNS